MILRRQLGADPETVSAERRSVCNIRIRDSNRGKDKAERDKKEATEWHRSRVLGLAEIAGQYRKKGSSVYDRGQSQARK
ncbi:single-stranded DNA-binding protein [Candidatus Accumulibacter sp. ACC012]|uniref:single-stranded DNA-binding protein n=1 Tax=Candidatus Accumulibacter sp. ACC012 TaxID=2823332 RepID=UPI0025C0307B|nr:single-stranded DNA-binding protein [Candidatus Accumulibacter sp. ACC012]